MLLIIPIYMLVLIVLLIVLLIVDEVVLEHRKNRINEQIEDIKLYAPKMSIDDKLDAPRNPELRESDKLLDTYWTTYWSSRINPDTQKPFEYIPPERHYADE